MLDAMRVMGCFVAGDAPPSHIHSARVALLCVTENLSGYGILRTTVLELCAYEYYTLYIYVKAHKEY